MGIKMVGHQLAHLAGSHWKNDSLWYIGRTLLGEFMQ